MESAGIIKAVGKDVEAEGKWHVGDLVWCCHLALVGNIWLVLLRPAILHKAFIVPGGETVEICAIFEFKIILGVIAEVERW